MQLGLTNWLNAPYDASNEDHQRWFTLSTCFLLGAFLQPAKWLVLWTWLPTYAWFIAFPEDFVD
jgi:hypothetical protein